MTDDERSIRELVATWMTANQAGDTLTILRKGQDGRWRLARDANLLSKVE